MTIALEDPLPYEAEATQPEQQFSVIEVTPANEPSPGFSFEFAHF